MQISINLCRMRVYLPVDALSAFFNKFPLRVKITHSELGRLP